MNKVRMALENGEGRYQKRGGLITRVVESYIDKRCAALDRELGQPNSKTFPLDYFPLLLLSCHFLPYVEVFLSVIEHSCVVNKYFIKKKKLVLILVLIMYYVERPCVYSWHRQESAKKASSTSKPPLHEWSLIIRAPLRIHEHVIESTCGPPLHEHPLESMNGPSLHGRFVESTSDPPLHKRLIESISGPPLHECPSEAASGLHYMSLSSIHKGIPRTCLLSTKGIP